MTETATYERYFVTRDRDVTFKMIEDESGDVFWGYGHRDRADFDELMNTYGV